jgi:hypothetical protein
MPSLWFVVPAHGRERLTGICLRQLRRTCDSLAENGIEASAVVVADDANLAVAAHLGFATVRRDNQFLSRRFNDGIQLALDPKWNPHRVDYVVPCGSDDWVDHRILLDLPDHNTVRGFQHISFVREDGREITSSVVSYEGGCGIRVYPRRLMTRLGYRPADEDRKRACDTSILMNVRHANPFVRIEHADTDPRQIVDWKTPGLQLNSYEGVSGFGRSHGDDPFTELAGWFPKQSLREMATHYNRSRERVLA